jgi:ATP-dependent exoDNAse (exonuclease V) alpha subunit
VHKAQGCTLSSAAIPLGSKKLDHMYYVALSRVRNLSSLYLLKFSEENIKVSSAVKEEMCRLRHDNIIQMPVPIFCDETEFQIIYHNL